MMFLQLHLSCPIDNELAASPAELHLQLHLFLHRQEKATQAFFVIVTNIINLRAKVLVYPSKPNILVISR